MLPFSTRLPLLPLPLLRSPIASPCLVGQPASASALWFHGPSCRSDTTYHPAYSAGCTCSPGSTHGPLSSRRLAASASSPSDPSPPCRPCSADAFRRIDGPGSRTSGYRTGDKRTHQEGDPARDAGPRTNGGPRHASSRSRTCRSPAMLRILSTASIHRDQHSRPPSPRTVQQVASCPGRASPGRNGYDQASAPPWRNQASGSGFDGCFRTCRSRFHYSG